MIFVTVEDFLEKAGRIPPLTREEELACAKRMEAGDMAARERLIQGCLPMTAVYIRRLPPERRTLELILRCCRAAEKAVDSFPFRQDGERFSHRLSWWMRQTVTAYLAGRD